MTSLSVTQIVLESRFELGSVWTRIYAGLPVSQLGTFLGVHGARRD